MTIGASELGLPEDQLEAADGTIRKIGDQARSIPWKKACSLLGQAAITQQGKHQGGSRTELTSSGVGGVHRRPAAADRTHARPSGRNQPCPCGSGRKTKRCHGSATPARVAIGPGELIVVPHQVEHRPVADDEVHVLLLEPTSTVNTGTAGGERTREAKWI